MPNSLESGSMEDDAERMDLALNSDLCSDFLDCWDDSTIPKPVNEKGPGVFSTGSRSPDAERNSSNNINNNPCWEGSDNGNNELSDLRTFLMDDDSRTATQNASTYPTRVSNHHHQHQQQPQTTVDAAATNTCTSHTSTSSVAAMVSSLTRQLHPQAIPSSAECPPHHTQQVFQQQHLISTAALLPLALNALAMGPGNGQTAQQQQQHIMEMLAAATASCHQQNTANAAIQQQQQQAEKAKDGDSTKAGPSSSHHTTAKPSNNDTVPPFLLFDAPMELRANFMQSQRDHGLPVLQDNNSYHYGMALSHGASSSSAGGGFHPSALDLRFMDARFGDTGNKRDKNAKEQKRAQQITKLIEQLRAKMENDGWKVELKSKFHTLSSCADYVKHLVQSNKAKEEAIEKVKQDLEAKKRRLEEDKTQQDPSDPESTTSDLTTESSRSSGTTTQSDVGGKAGQTTSSSASGGDEKASRSSEHSIPAHRMSSIVSDLTEGNKGRTEEKASSSKGNTSSTTAQEKDANVESSSVVSASATDAAGVKINPNTPGETAHADVVIQGGATSNKRKLPSLTTRGAITSFDLDYEEVFVKSNVPQVLSTTAGRIVASNDFFLKATGLARDEVKRLTIFSLVKSNKLAKLFDIVAAALRTGCIGSSSSEDGEQANGDQLQPWDYSGITLPCVDFSRPSEHRRPLFMTVTLMADEDPRKRCFHCVFADCPGTNGNLGSITPALLSELFKGKPPTEHRRELGSMRKKRKTGD